MSAVYFFLSRIDFYIPLFIIHLRPSIVIMFLELAFPCFPLVNICARTKCYEHEHAFGGVPVEKFFSVSGIHIGIHREL